MPLPTALAQITLPRKLLVWLIVQVPFNQMDMPICPSKSQIASLTGHPDQIEAIRAQYQKMPAFLHEEGQHYLERLQKKGEDIFQQLNESKARMKHLREMLRGMYEELKETGYKPDVELLQAFGDILYRCEFLLLQVPKPVNPELSTGPITGLVDKLRGFRVDITMHPERANSHIFLQGDLRSMNVGSESEQQQVSQCVSSELSVQPITGVMDRWTDSTTYKGECQPAEVMTTQCPAEHDIYKLMKSFRVEYEKCYVVGNFRWQP
ncbi:hypothetical protein P7K49_022472 [Saguinus oedipus]|uniref:Uncharacterized protein n=1 Tax=Saguinus oedipus TaxID=9490 RepID=A0ABQ9UWE4_SAGOE|nr:hypothetical protein P7K49_022472 [Saguinus oedipus]